MQKTRKNIRLTDYDYSQSGYYFVTVCTQNREAILGNVVNGKMVLNEFGKIVDEKIIELNKYKNIIIDTYCVMPNHVHLILIVGADPRVRPNGLGSTQGSTPTIGEYVKRFKTLTTHIYIENVKQNNWPPFNKRLFQRNYGACPERSRRKHIIRNEIEHLKIKEYIQSNPSMWERDRNNPKNMAHHL